MKLGKIGKDIVLRIAGIDWLDWLSFEVGFQIDALCPSFSFGIIERFDGKAQHRPIAAGMPCEVLLMGQVIMTGYVDKADYAYGNAAHSITVTGRGKQCDVVDCSALNSPGSWNGVKTERIIGELCEPFGVGVIKHPEIDTGPPVDSFKLEEGETAFAAVDRLLKQAELLAIPFMDGKIIITKIGAGMRGDELIQGVNIIEASASYDVSDRFSDYVVKGQRQGSDDCHGEAASQVTGAARDGSVQRYRPMVVRAESQVSPDSAVKRAKWEASVRAARGVTVTCKVHGWQKEDGRLWYVNQLAPVSIPYLKLDQDLLVAGVKFGLTKDGGSLTELSLKDPEAFTPEPPPEEKGGGGGGGGGKRAKKELQYASADEAWSAHKEMAADGQP